MNQLKNNGPIILISVLSTLLVVLLAAIVYYFIALKPKSTSINPATTTTNAYATAASTVQSESPDEIEAVQDGSTTNTVSTKSPSKSLTPQGDPLGTGLYSGWTGDDMPNIDPSDDVYGIGRYPMALIPEAWQARLEKFDQSVAPQVAELWGIPTDQVYRKVQGWNIYRDRDDKYFLSYAVKWASKEDHCIWNEVFFDPQTQEARSDAEMPCLNE